MSERRVLHLNGDAEVERWLDAMDNTRLRTMELLQGMSDADLERGEPNSVGSLLYHLALIEADWLYDEILNRPEDMPKDLFPHEHREENGVLTPVTGMTVDDHLDTLQTVRRQFVEAVRGLSLESFLRVNERSLYDVSVVYVLHHLLQHEAEHRAEIGRALAR